MKRYLCIAIGAAVLISAATAQTQRNRRGNNFNINMQGDAESCADVRVTSSNGELSRASEQFALSRGEASTVELNAGDRGVIKVRGWGQPGYSVEACKMAVAGDRGTADQLLRGITVSHSAGRFSYTGPSSDNGNWQVYFIIHTPDNASLDLETRNAPVSISDVKGNVKVRATNGPLSINRSMGTIDAQTENGPISFEGEGGEVRLHAQNGPISVAIQKEFWNGPALEARTVNGPMTLSLPTAFQSGVRVEASENAPISCKHDACTHAYTNAASDHRILQLNGSSETVRVSTDNGPLSVVGPRGKKF